MFLNYKTENEVYYDICFYVKLNDSTIKVYNKTPFLGKFYIQLIKQIIRKYVFKISLTYTI